MPLTYKGSLMALEILALIETNKAALGAQQVLYGDRPTIAESPTVCVEPAQKVRTPAGSPMMMDNEVRVSIIVYSTSIEGADVAQKNGDLCSEAIEELLNLKSQPPTLYQTGTLLNGLVTAGWVESVEAGYKLFRDRMMRANRIVWAGYSHTHLVTDSLGAKHA